MREWLKAHLILIRVRRVVLVRVAVGRVHLVDGHGVMVVLHLGLLLRLLRLAAVVEQILLLLLWMLLLLWCSSILLLGRRLHFVGVLVMLLMLRVARTCVDTEMVLPIVWIDSHFTLFVF